MLSIRSVHNNCVIVDWLSRTWVPVVVVDRTGCRMGHRGNSRKITGIIHTNRVRRSVALMKGRRDDGLSLLDVGIERKIVLGRLRYNRKRTYIMKAIQIISVL